MVTLSLHQAGLPANLELLFSVSSNPHKRSPSQKLEAHKAMWGSHFLLEARGANSLLSYLCPLLMVPWLLAMALQSVCLPSRGLLLAAHVKKVIHH